MAWRLSFSFPSTTADIIMYITRWLQPPIRSSPSPPPSPSPRPATSITTSRRPKDDGRRGFGKVLPYGMKSQLRKATLCLHFNVATSSLRVSTTRITTPHLSLRLMVGSITTMTMAPATHRPNQIHRSNLKRAVAGPSWREPT